MLVVNIHRSLDAAAPRPGCPAGGKFSTVQPDIKPPKAWQIMKTSLQPEKCSEEESFIEYV